MMGRTIPFTTCASTTTLSPWRSWRDWRRLRASAGCISGALCRNRAAALGPRRSRPTRGPYRQIACRGLPVIAAPLLDGQGFADRLRGRSRRAYASRERHQLRLAAGAHAGNRRRIRLRQERDGAGHHAAADRRPARAFPARSAFEGRELASLPERQMRDLRGNRLAMIFQEPMTSLNPSFTIGDQVAEVLVRHRGLAAAAARRSAIDMLARVRIPSPAARAEEYPHKLSGGMRQRVMIAMALACAPALADRRRTDDGARRHHPGTNPRSALAICAKRPGQPSS